MDSSSRQALFDKFDPEFYLQRKVGENENYKKSNAFLCDWMYGVFSKGYIRGENLLDIGTGPAINSVVYASSYFNKIYLSDLSINCRKYLREWCEGSHRNLELTFFEEAVKREGNVQTPAEKEQELLGKIGGILHCDVLQENPLKGKEQQPLPGLFDAVTTCWCVNNAGRTVTEYEKVLKNISSVIKPGGYLVLMAINNYSKDYEVNGIKFPSACFEVDQLKKLFDTPYMELLNWVYEENVVTFGSLYNIVAKIL